MGEIINLFGLECTANTVNTAVCKMAGACASKCLIAATLEVPASMTDFRADDPDLAGIFEPIEGFRRHQDGTPVLFSQIM
jgi:hypothetical protein